MATLTLSSWFIQNTETGDTVANDVNPKLRKLAFGDKYDAFFTYVLSGTSLTANTEIRFNPGVFVKDGFQDITNLGSGNETYGLRLNTVTTTFQDMIFFGTNVNSYSTGRNETYQIKKIDGVTFQIKMSFYMTSDTASYLGFVTGGQYSRLVADRFSQTPTLYTNTNTTNYTTNASLDTYTLGLYCSVTYRQAPSAQVVINSAAGTITTSPLYGIDFLADGWDDPCGDGSTLVEIKVYQQGTAAGNTYVAQANLILGSVTSTTLVFTSLVGFPSGGYVIDIEPVFCTGLITYGVLGDNNAKLRQWDWLNIDGLFANEGLHTDRDFQLLRSGSSVSTINTTNPTNIQFDLTYTGSDVTKAKMWMIPTNTGNDTTEWWIDALDRNPLQFQDTPVPVNIIGNEWRITVTIDPITYNLNVGEVYHFLFVLYDDTDNYYASYTFVKDGSFNVRVSNELEIPTDGVYKVPLLTGFMSTYKDEFPVDGLGVSPLQRVAVGINFDKTDYNTVTNFNRVQSITASLSYTDGTVLDQTSIVVTSGVALSTDPNLIVTDSPAAMEAVWKFRIEHEYTNQELIVTWKINSLTEPTETFFTQKFRVDDYQQNLPLLEQKLTDTIFYENDINGFILEESDRNCEGNVIAVETVRNVPISEDYYQAAVWLNDDLIVAETDGFPDSLSYLPTVADTDIFDVEGRFSDFGTNDKINFKVNSVVNNGEVGMIGYPPPLPNNFGRVMIHITNPNGRNVTFAAQDDISPGTKAFSTLGGTSVSSDYTFRIGTSSAILNDANNVNWALYPSISFAALLGSTIPMNTYVRVEYNGSLTNHTDIVSYLQYARTLGPAYPRVIPKTFPSTRLANNDLMLYSGTTLSYLSVGTPSTTRFTESRTSAELAASSDLTDFQPGEFAWNSGLAARAGHIFLQPGAVGGYDTVSIAVSSFEPNIQVTTYASPLSNLYYPTTGNGTNLNAIKGDAINDLLYVPAGATGGDLLYPSNMALNEERSYTWLGMQNALGTYFEGGGEFIRYLGNSNVVNMRLGAAQIQYLFEGADAFSFANTPVKYVTFTIKRLALTGIASAMYDINLYVNGRKMTNGTKTGTITTNTYTLGTTRFNLGLLNSIASPTLTNSFRNQNLNYLAVHKRILSKKEIRELHLGKDVALSLPNYHYIFTNLVVDGGNRRIVNVGSDPIDDARLENHTNTLSPLIP